MKKFLLILVLCVSLTLSCATNDEGAKKVGRGFGKAAVGVAQLVLSPLQIAAGLLEGIAAIPYYMSTSLEDINKGMIDANAKITIDDTYEAAYGKRISAVDKSGDTGEVFRRMKHATEYFQKVLRRYGVHDAENYILTSIDSATGKGYTLFAVVYRPQAAIRVPDKADGSTPRTYTRGDRLYYEPFEKDLGGRSLDVIIDWAGLPREYITTQKGQALMLTMAANSVVNEKKSPDYWDIEKRWIAGEYEAIVDQRMNAVKNRMKIGD
ncbi:MAG: hypothetical protein K4571_00455 [Deltaproteobacteria bacterium]